MATAVPGLVGGASLEMLVATWAAARETAGIMSASDWRDRVG
jgi:hypothetical protein